MNHPAKPSERAERSEFAANVAMLPPERMARHGRTFARSWDGAEYGAALIRFRRRANRLDRLAWIASAALVLGTLWMVYG